LLGSETPSVDFEAVETGLEAPAAALDEPSREGGASGVEPTADVVVDWLEDESALGDFIIFSVRGTWKASTARSTTLPTARITFCRLAFALGSNFFFAISSFLRSGSVRPWTPVSWC
jgi:hypothetical protein